MNLFHYSCSVAMTACYNDRVRNGDGRRDGVELERRGGGGGGGGGGEESSHDKHKMVR